MASLGKLRKGQLWKLKTSVANESVLDKDSSELEELAIEKKSKSLIAVPTRLLMIGNESVLDKDSSELEVIEIEKN